MTLLITHDSDSWYEGYANTLLNFTSAHSGTFTWTGSSIYPYENPPGEPTFTFNDFKGKVSIISVPANVGSHQNQMFLNPATGSNVLFLTFSAADADTTPFTANVPVSPGNFAFQYSLKGNEALPIQMGRNDTAWLLVMLNQLRSDFNLKSPVGPFNPDRRWTFNVCVSQNSILEHA